MKEEVEEGIYTRRLYPSDWRSSASIVGLLKYYEFLEEKKNVDSNYKIDNYYIEYNHEDITKERYLDFVEYHFKNDLHHTEVKRIIKGEEKFSELEEEKQKLLKEKLKANVVMKKVMKEINIEKCHLSDVEKLIEENRHLLIEETYKNGLSLYRMYSNPNNFYSTEKGKSPRLKGYSLDAGRKLKSAGYMQDQSAYVHSDMFEYDFIPFAFSKTRESVFINSSSTIENLMYSNRQLEKKTDENILGREGEKSKSINSLLFEFTKESSTFIEYGVEVIKRERDNEIYESLYVRDESIEIFKEIGEYYEKIRGSLKVNGQWYYKEKEVVKSVLNLMTLDRDIIYLIKNGKGVLPLININIAIKKKVASIYNKDREGEMIKYENITQGIEKSKNTGFIVRKKLEKKTGGDQKVKSFKNKLVTALTFRDYNSFKTTLLKLSDYSGVVFEFAYDLFDDFEKNIDIAYAFVNALNVSENKEIKENK